MVVRGLDADLGNSWCQRRDALKGTVGDLWNRVLSPMTANSIVVSIERLRHLEKQDSSEGSE